MAALLLNRATVGAVPVVLLGFACVEEQRFDSSSGVALVVSAEALFMTLGGTAGRGE
ncbi:hypothetical protein [Streptomyces sp. NPDC059957]|uniref:hypothetical protein n=1 Tax=unclassified Streptomyces TaxID=2593676 RepID=UPI003660D410